MNQFSYNILVLDSAFPIQRCRTPGGLNIKNEWEIEYRSDDVIKMLLRLPFIFCFMLFPYTFHENHYVLSLPS